MRATPAGINGGGFCSSAWLPAAPLQRTTAHAALLLLLTTGAVCCPHSGAQSLNFKQKQCQS
jgi:hypothetical protein